MTRHDLPEQDLSTLIFLPLLVPPVQWLASSLPSATKTWNRKKKKRAGRHDEQPEPNVITRETNLITDFSSHFLFFISVISLQIYERQTIQFLISALFRVENNPPPHHTKTTHSHRSLHITEDSLNPLQPIQPSQSSFLTCVYTPNVSHDSYKPPNPQIPPPLCIFIPFHPPPSSLYPTPANYPFSLSYSNLSRSSSYPTSSLHHISSHFLLILHHLPPPLPFSFPLPLSVHPIPLLLFLFSGFRPKDGKENGEKIIMEVRSEARDGGEGGKGKRGRMEERMEGGRVRGPWSASALRRLVIFLLYQRTRSDLHN